MPSFDTIGPQVLRVVDGCVIPFLFVAFRETKQEG